MWTPGTSGQHPLGEVAAAIAAPSPPREHARRAAWQESMPPRPREPGERDEPGESGALGEFGQPRSQDRRVELRSALPQEEFRWPAAEASHAIWPLR
jgi:hypothetical protein